MHLYRPCQLIADLPADGEAKADALSCNEAPLFELAHGPKYPEEPLQHVFVHANASVIDSCHEEPTLRADAYTILIVQKDVDAPFVSELDSILDDVQEYLLISLLVTYDLI